MTEAGGTTTLSPITNVGDYQFYEILNDSVSDGETITIPSAAPFWTSDKIVIHGALNETSGAQLSGASLSVQYSESNLQFTFNEGGASDDAIRVFFYRVGVPNQ